MTQLEKSGDIDWATSEFGGEVAGEFVVGDAVIAGVLGKAATLVRGADEAADAARIAGKIDDAADAARTAGKLADDLPTGTAKHRKRMICPRPGRMIRRRRAGLPEARPYDNTRPLPDSGKKPTQLADDALETIERNQGFKKNTPSA